MEIESLVLRFGVENLRLDSLNYGEGTTPQVAERALRERPYRYVVRTVDGKHRHGISREDFLRLKSMDVPVEKGVL